MSMDELIACEERIKGGFAEQAIAFKEIANDGLYKSAGYKSFEDYAEQRANCGANYGWKMVKAGNVVQAIIDDAKGRGQEPRWLPANERQAREFARLKPNANGNEQDVVHAVEVVYDHAPKKNGEPIITSNGIRETLIAKKFVPPPPKRSAEQKAQQEYNRQLRSINSACRAVADLKGELSAKQAYKKFGDSIFTTGYEEALAYLLELEELRNG